MKNKTLLFLLCLFIPLTAFSQRKKKSKGKTISLTTSLNFQTKITTYSFAETVRGTTLDDLVLNYVNRNGGTFTIEEGDTITIERMSGGELPTQLFNIGASVQILTGTDFFHEISLTKLSYSKSSFETIYKYTRSSGEESFNILGYDQRATAFAFRYEFGKYLLESYKSKVRFGLSLGIEPSFYFYKRTPRSQNGYPIKANVQTLDLSLVPALSFKLSKKMFLDFKVITNLTVGHFGDAREQNPNVRLDEQKGDKGYEVPDLNMAFSVLLRYNIKEPKKRGRRKKVE